MNIKSNIKSHIKSNIIKQILRQNQGKYSSVDAQADSGYTLVEVLVVVVIVTTLAVIGVLTGFPLLNRTAVNNAQSEMFQAIRSAQTEARQKKGTWGASFQNATNANGEQMIQWAVHSGSEPPAWQAITVKGVQIDPDNTSFEKNGNYWRIQFNERGEVEESSPTSPQPPVKITLFKSGNVNNKRFVCVQTLLGAMKTGNMETGNSDKCEK